jgi:HEAT repeat protein
MLVSMAAVLTWAAWIGWQRWPEWRAVREMQAAVEANEPGRFLDAIEQVDSIGVAEAAAEEIAPLGQHPDPRVRMYAVMARTVLGPRGPDEAKELIELFDDPDEDGWVRSAAAHCLVVFGEHAAAAKPSLKRASTDMTHPERNSAYIALTYLEAEQRGFMGRRNSVTLELEPMVPDPGALRGRIAEFLLRDCDSATPWPPSSEPKSTPGSF